VYVCSSQGSKEDDEEMKFGKLRTLRGQVDVVGGVARKNLILADGLVNYGLKIKSFTLWIDDQTTIHTMQGILSLDTISSGSSFNAGDNRQFSWTFYANSGAIGEVVALQTIIDPDHIVNRDLFLSMFASTDATYNYLIEAQVVELTDDEAIITIIKETSQS
tara:strand:- start:93 stop:578 length:486 start_codon:yes stop_codon:yes gene_type:complete